MRHRGLVLEFIRCGGQCVQHVWIRRAYIWLCRNSDTPLPEPFRMAKSGSTAPQYPPGTDTESFVSNASKWCPSAR